MQSNEISELFNFDDMKTEITKEYVAYTIDMECAMRTLQKKLEVCENPKQIALTVMRTIVDFYDAEWCGAVDVDLDLGVWTTFWWYSQELGEMPARKCKEIEIMDNFEHWYTSIRSREPLMLSDTSVFKESDPEEYELYDRLDIRSIMAVPFWMHSTGVLALKNPKKHNNQIGLLRLLSYPVVSSINEYRLQEANRLSVVSPRISSQSDVFISLFGELKITTAKGVLTESELKSPKIAKLIAYLLLSKRPAVTPREIADAIAPDEENEYPGKNVKSWVYRLQQVFSLISDYRLIESTPIGYQINPKLNIFTDLKLFDTKWEMSLKTSQNEDKEELLKKLVDLYEGDVLHSSSSEHWLMPVATAYQYRYIGAVNELMKVLWAEKHYHHIHSYAAKALTIVPHNPDIHYWLIRSMENQGHFEMARSELLMAKTRLDEESYAILEQRLLSDGKCVKITP